MTVRSQTHEQQLPREPTPIYKPGRMPRLDFFMALASLYTKRSTCLRGQVGCIAVRDRYQIAAGYNGAPAGMPHCIDVGCGGAVDAFNPETGDFVGQNFPHGCTRSIHAEINMIAHAARWGLSLEGATVYSTHGPCLPCAQAYVASGISCLVYRTPYRLPEGLKLIDDANIEITHYQGKP